MIFYLVDLIMNPLIKGSLSRDCTSRVGGVSTSHFITWSLAVSLCSVVLCSCSVAACFCRARVWAFSSAFWESSCFRWSFKRCFSVSRDAFWTADGTFYTHRTDDGLRKKTRRAGRTFFSTSISRSFSLSSSAVTSLCSVSHFSWLEPDSSVAFWEISDWTASSSCLCRRASSVFFTWDVSADTSQKDKDGQSSQSKQTRSNLNHLVYTFALWKTALAVDNVQNMYMNKQKTVEKLVEP